MHDNRIFCFYVVSFQSQKEELRKNYIWSKFEFKNGENAYSRSKAGRSRFALAIFQVQDFVDLVQKTAGTEIFINR